MSPWDPTSNSRAYILLVLTALCWGANAVFGRLAVGEVSPIALVSLRWLGALCLLFIFAREDIKRDWPVLRANIRFLALMGACGFTAFNALFYIAAHSTTAVNIGIIQGSIPVFVLLGAFVVYQTRVSGLQIAGVIVAIIGVAVVVTCADMNRITDLTFNFGDLLMIVACVFYASYTVGLRKLPPLSSMSLFTMMAFWAFVFSLPLTAAEIVHGSFQAPSLRGWGVIALVTLFPSFLAQIFFIQGVTIIGPGRAGIFVNLVPVFAALMAVFILGEPFEIFHAIALSMVLGGIWLSERGKVS